MAQAVRQLPQSVRTWMKAATLESEMKAKKKVFRKGTHCRIIAFCSVAFARYHHMMISSQIL